MITQRSSSDIISNDFMSLLDKNGRVKHGTWKKKENHIIYAIWLGERLGYKNTDDWYQISVKDIKKYYGGGLLISQYSDSPLLFLESVFPDTEWFPWMFEYCPKKYWVDKKNHIIYAKWLGKTLGYKNMDDWYQIKKKKIYKIIMEVVY